jgi:hypothetical protein
LQQASLFQNLLLNYDKSDAEINLPAGRLDQHERHYFVFLTKSKNSSNKNSVSVGPLEASG